MNAKPLLVGLILLAGVNILGAQTVVSLVGEGRDISPVIFGFNGRSTEGPSWSDDTFLSIVDSMYPGSVRYPAGTQANYWDWRYGTFIEGSGKTASYIFTIGDFAKGLPAETNIIYVVNMARPTPATGISLNAPADVLESISTLQLKILDILEAIAEFESHGRLPDAVEFGNEFYFDNEHGAIYAANPHLYLQHSKILATAIKSEYPSIKILLCTSKGGTSGRDYWNNSVFTALATDSELIPLIHGVVQHHYINSNYGDPTIVTDLETSERAIAEGFIYTGEIVPDYEMVPDGFRLWITEYGATKENAESTWASGLRAGAMTMGMLDLGENLEMLNFSPITNHPD